MSIRAAAGCGCLCICVSVCHEGCVVGSSSSPRCSWSLRTVQSPLVALPPGRWPWLVWVSLCTEEGKSTRWRRQPSWCGAFPKSRWRVPVHLGGFQKESGRVRDGRATTRTRSLSHSEPRSGDFFQYSMRQRSLSPHQGCIGSRGYVLCNCPIIRAPFSFTCAQVDKQPSAGLGGLLLPHYSRSLPCQPHSFCW